MPILLTGAGLTDDPKITFSHRNFQSVFRGSETSWEQSCAKALSVLRGNSLEGSVITLNSTARQLHLDSLGDLEQVFLISRSLSFLSTKRRTGYSRMYKAPVNKQTNKNRRVPQQGPICTHAKQLRCWSPSNLVDPGALGHLPAPCTALRAPAPPRAARIPILHQI